jgi:hypothetical protein
MRRVPRAADPRELPLVLVLLAATLAEGHWSADAEGLSPLGVLAALLLVVPLLWRHAVPHVVLAFVVLGVFACMATSKPGWSVVAASAVAIYSVALYGGRVRSLLTAGCILAVTVTVMTLFSDRGLLSYDALTRLGILLIALILGDAVRGRRAERAAPATRPIGASATSACASPARSMTSWPTRWSRSTCRPASRPTWSTSAPARPRPR